MNLKRKPDEQGIKHSKRWALIKFIIITLLNFVVVYIAWCNSAIMFAFFNARQYKSDLYFIAKNGFSLDLLAGYYGQLFAIVIIVIAAIVAIILAKLAIKARKVRISSILISTAILLTIANTYGSLMRIG